MRLYGTYCFLFLSLLLFFSCQDEEGGQGLNHETQKIAVSFRLFEHGNEKSINQDPQHEDFVEKVQLVGAGMASTSGNLADFQISAFQGKRSLFFVANMEGEAMDYTSFNTKLYLSEPYIAIHGIKAVKLPMVATLRDVECRTSSVGGSVNTSLYQNGNPIGMATPIVLKRVFARVDCRFSHIANDLKHNTSWKLELVNVPRYFQLGAPINDYDLLNKADKYLPPIDLTDVCKNTNGVFSLYLPEHYVSHPGFNEVEEGANMTRIRINYGATQEFGIPIGKKEGGFDFGQISRNKVYQIAK